MKKTIIGTILGILLVWSIYFLFVTRESLMNAISNRTNPDAQFRVFLFAVAALILILLFLINNSTRDRKVNTIAERMRANTVLSEQNEREKQIASEVSKKSYITISNFLIILMMTLPIVYGNRTFSVNQILATMAVILTLESILFMYRYYRLYSEK